MGAASTYRRVGLSYKLPAGALHLFTPESLEHANGVVTGWRDEITGLVLAANGVIYYTPQDYNLAGQASALVSRYAYFDPFPLVAPTALTMACVTQDRSGLNSPQQLPYLILDNPGLLSLNQGPAGDALLWGEPTSGATLSHQFSAYDKRLPHLISTTMATRDMNQARLFVDGTELSLSLSGTLPQRPNPVRAWLGYVEVAVEYSFEGAQSFYVFYDRQLTAKELVNLHGYLRSQYSIPLFH